MANPGSSRVTRDPFELLGALSKWRNLTFDPRPRGTPDWASVWRNSKWRQVDRQMKCKNWLKGLLFKWVCFYTFRQFVEKNIIVYHVLKHLNVDSPEKYSIVLPRMLTNSYKTIKRYERPPLRTVELYSQHSHVIWANQVLDLHCTIPS